MSKRFSELLVALLLAASLLGGLQVLDVAMGDGPTGRWAGDATL
jgi:hypothetical protein